MDNLLPEPLQRSVYKLLKESFLEPIKQSMMGVLSSVWSVYEKKATGEDSRYKWLGDEIEKHYVMNDDWEEDKLFISILKIFGDEAVFRNFVQEVVSLFVAQEGEEAKPFKDIVELLDTEKISLKKTNGSNGYAIYVLVKDGDKYDIEDKNVPFILCKSNVTHAVKFFEEDIETPKQTNCFILTFNDKWNDFSYMTRFHLYYYDENKKSKYIGELKIAHKDSDNTTDVLPKKFTSLDDNFCSLGMSRFYYQKLQDMFGTQKALTYLFELKDCACLQFVANKFEDKPVMRHSLLRDDDAEEALRLGKYLVYGRNVMDAYHFDYKFKPKYEDDEAAEHIIPFHFEFQCSHYQRAIGIVGENGTGKTTLLNNLIKSLLDNDNKNFDGLRPLFKTLVVVSYSPFDSYPAKQDRTTYTMDYEYCGLVKNSHELYSVKEQSEQLADNIERLYKRNTNRLVVNWRELVGEVVSMELLDTAFLNDELEDVEIERKRLLEICMHLSSGEAMFLYSITAIMSRIRKATLLIFDEPEQHLHPHAITMLMNAICRLLNAYESYAIITTHSPFVAREMIGSNVFVFHREDNNLLFGKIKVESFGEDVSLLSNVIFENMNVNKHYEMFIAKVTQDCQYDYEETMQALERKGITPVMNVKLLVMSEIHNHTK